jgi:UDP-N-acetylmuramyl tripeptide synthase
MNGVPTLHDIAASLDAARRARIIGDETTTGTGMTHDSRQVVAGVLFACVRGDHHDGLA